MHTLRILVLAAAVVVVGCGKKRVAPAKEELLELAGKKASYRDWAKITPCDVEPKTVKGDLESTSALLTEYLAQTAGAADAAWTPEQLATLEAGLAKLGPVLDATEKVIAAAPKCKFKEKDGVEAPLKQATDLAGQARKRLADGPALAEGLRAKAAIADWKAKMPEAQTAAKGEWCPPKPKPGAMPDIFFAFEDDTGRIEWIFCDDSKVVVPNSGAAPAFEAAAALKKKPKDKPYLDSAAKYPASDIQHPPKPAPKDEPPKEEAPKEAPAPDGGTKEEPAKKP